MVYQEIFLSNSYRGKEVGKGVVCSAMIPIMTGLQLYRHPFLNRFGEIAPYNLLENSYIERIKPTSFPIDLENSVNSFIYRGLRHEVKYIPNLVIQNYFKDNWQLNSPYKLLNDPINVFIPTFMGMTTFFTIGALESKITSPVYKWIFTSVDTIGIFALSSNNAPTYKTDAGATHLSLQSMMLTDIAFIFAFLTVDLANYYKPSLAKQDTVPHQGSISGLDILTITTIGLIASKEVSINWQDYQNEKISLLDASINVITVVAKEGARIGAFQFAKANAATGTELIINNMPVIITDTATMLVKDYIEPLAIDAINIMMDNPIAFTLLGVASLAYYYSPTIEIDN